MEGARSMRNRRTLGQSLFVSLAVSGIVAVTGCTTSEEGGPGGSGGAMGSGGVLAGSGGANGSGGMIAGSGGARMDAAPEVNADSGGMDSVGDVAGGAATFTELYTTIFSMTMAASPSSCAGAMCHDPGKNGMVDMSTKATAYQGLRAKVVPNNPNGSGLISRLKNPTT